jgi:hypothetical protein
LNAPSRHERGAALAWNSDLRADGDGLPTGVEDREQRGARVAVVCRDLLPDRGADGGGEPVEVGGYGAPLVGYRR